MNALRQDFVNVEVHRFEILAKAHAIPDLFERHIGLLKKPRLFPAISRLHQKGKKIQGHVFQPFPYCVPLLLGEFGDLRDQIKDQIIGLSDDRKFLHKNSSASPNPFGLGLAECKRIKEPRVKLL